MSDYFSDNYREKMSDERAKRIEALLNAILAELREANAQREATKDA